MERDKQKRDSMDLILIDQRAVQDKLASWTYQATARIVLFTVETEVLGVRLLTSQSAKESDIELADMTISFNNLNGNAFQIQSVLNNVNVFTACDPIVRIGISKESNTAPDTWRTLQEKTIEALKVIPVDGTRTSVTLHIELSGLTLPYVRNANTAVQCSFGDIRFKQWGKPDTRYIGNFELVNKNKPFSSMAKACEAMIAFGLPIPVKKVGLSCVVGYRYIPEGSTLSAQVPVVNAPFSLVENTKRFSTVLSESILTWLKQQDIAQAAKGELLFTLTIYAPDENVKEPWLIIESVVLSLNSVHVTD